jgi:hypothetical protein
MGDIRAGLVANLATITGCQKAAYRTGNATPPALVVAGFGGNIERIAMGSWSLELLIQGLAGKTLNSAAERKLDAWLLPGGDQDVWAAIESDKTLGGKVSDLHVSANDGTQILTLDNGTEVLGTTWHVEIEL